MQAVRPVGKARRIQYVTTPSSMLFYIVCERASNSQMRLTVESVILHVDTEAKGMTLEQWSPQIVLPGEPYGEVKLRR